MLCTQCGNEFTSQRSTAQFCSSKCRVDYSRNKTIDLAAERGEEEPEKKIPEILETHQTHCKDCQTFSNGLHWCPNKVCACFQTKEEQEKDILKLQETCPHPEEERLHSRCLNCMTLVLAPKEDNEPIEK